MTPPKAKALLCVVLGSCAAPASGLVEERAWQGAHVKEPEPTLEFTGQPYTIRHRKGTITGTVCGSDVNYDVDRRDEYIQLVGMVDGVDTQLRVEFRGMSHIITGSLGTKAVELHLVRGAIQGYVGLNGYGLRGDGDSLVGRVHSRKNQAEVVNLRLNGRDALWDMPPADQAAVVPLLLLCLYSDLRYQFGHEPPALGFGGPPTAMPRGTLVHTH